MVASRSVIKGGTLNLSDVTRPTRTGYSFKGWSTTEGGALISSVTPTADTTLYAVWEGDNVTYTVVYWGENADDTNYSALATATLTGKVGSTVTLNATTGTLPKSVSDRQHFKFSRSDSATIRADGSSVLNVYFSRNSYKLTFKEEDGLFISGKVITTIEAKYDSDIANVWEKGKVKEYLDAGYVFESSVTGDYYSFLQKMPNQDITMTATQWSGYEHYIYYYLEVLPGQNTSGLTLKKDRGRTYYLYHTTIIKGSSSLVLTYDEDYFPITGFTQRDEEVPSFSSKRVDYRTIIYEASLYYLRSSFNLTLSNYGVETKEAVPYETDISAKGAQPARPASFSENAVFKGWYEVPVGQITDSTLPFDFANKTMPAKDLVLFAYWVEQPVTLTVQVPTLGGYTASNYEVAIGTVISGVDVFKDAEAKIAAAGRTVLKWVYEDGTAVDVNSAIGSDTIVKAVLEGEVYNLTYVTGTDAAITDENRYEYEALAQVKDGSGLKSGDKVFACWTDETGKVYYPGSYVTMTGNKTLTANYVDPSVKVTLTYHSNFDTDQTKTIDAVPNNDKVTVMAYDATGLPSRLGYQVKGWKDANGVEYAAGSEARLDNVGSNDLYAVWEAIDVDYKVEFYYQDANGNYLPAPNKTDVRQGKTDSTVSVTAADKANKENGKYVYDIAAANVETGTVTANGSLVLKLYFKLNQASCTVRYLWNDTDVKVAEDDVFDSQTVSKTFTADPKTIANCTIVPEHNVTKSITVDPKSDNNVITFYYYKNVTLTANSKTREYNGFEQSVEGFTGAPEDADFSAITVGAKGTDAGVYPAEFAAGTVGKTDADKKYIVVEAIDGSLVISPISAVITITAASDSKPYDGTPLTNDRYTFTQGVLVDGDVLQAVVEGSQTDKGSSANVVKSYKVVRGSDDVTGNYKFTNSVDGTLTVTPRVVVIESEGGRRVYNGQPLTNPNYKFTTGSFVDGEVSEVKTTGTITEVGSVDNTIVYTTTDKFDANNYDITLTPGKLEITPVTAEVVVTITENRGSAKYDGTEKTVTGYEVTSISDPLYKESYQQGH